MTFIRISTKGSKTPNNIYCTFSFACGIEMKEMVVVTGGKVGVVHDWGVGGEFSGRVDVYNENGHKEQFPDLRTPRAHHGCAHFVNSQNRVVSILCTIWL